MFQKKFTSVYLYKKELVGYIFFYKSVKEKRLMNACHA